MFVFFNSTVAERLKEFKQTLIQQLQLQTEASLTS